MKKTLTVNLNSIVYHIDEDAYSLLKKYLNNIKYYFRFEEGVDEIMVDIEARISELFSESLPTNFNVISKLRVEEVIEQLGQPEEIAGEERVDEFGKTSADAKDFKKRKLYRNPDDKMLGGVISGIAAFYGLDTSILRFVSILLCFLSLSTLFFIYIILWIIVPEAMTAEEKLIMRGEDINMHNIGKTVTESFDKAQNEFVNFVQSDKTRTRFYRFIDSLVRIVGLLFKAGLIIFAFCVGIPILVLFVLFIVLVIAGLIALIGGGQTFVTLFPLCDSPFILNHSLALFASSLGGVVAFGLPLFAVCYLLYQRVFQWERMGKGLKITLIIIWIISLIVLIFGLLQINWPFVF